MNKTALVIEDDADTRDLLNTHLERLGFTVEHAHTGEAGLASVEKNVPALVILDILLPGIDGWEVLRQLRENPATTGLPVIVTTILDQESTKTGFEINGYLPKPFRSKDVSDVVNRVMNPAP